MPDDWAHGSRNRWCCSMSTPDVRQALARDAFERFHGARKNKGLKKAAQRCKRLPAGTYADDSVQRHWWTWQNSRAALAEQPAGVPEGWQLVPEVPTVEMLLAAHDVFGHALSKLRYRAMLAAAPKPEDTN